MSASTPETAYKGRIDAGIKFLARLVQRKYWFSALGIYAKNGVPDKMYLVGSILFFFEHKRKGKKPGILQQARIDKFVQHNQIAFSLAADPDSTGLRGNERRALYEELIKWLEPEASKKRAVRYLHDCRQVRKTLLIELEHMGEPSERRPKAKRRKKKSRKQRREVRPISDASNEL